LALLIAESEFAAWGVTRYKRFGGAVGSGRRRVILDGGVDPRRSRMDFGVPVLGVTVRVLKSMRH
jgi:hypothetical protein